MISFAGLWGTGVSILAGVSVAVGEGDGTAVTTGGTTSGGTITGILDETSAELTEELEVISIEAGASGATANEEAMPSELTGDSEADQTPREDSSEPNENEELTENCALLLTSEDKLATDFRVAESSLRALSLDDSPSEFKSLLGSTSFLQANTTTENTATAKNLAFIEETSTFQSIKRLNVSSSLE